MASELDSIDLNKLSIEKVKELKNEAIKRLKAAGDVPMMQQSHQDGVHVSHSNHATHSNVLEPDPGGGS